MFVHGRAHLFAPALVVQKRFVARGFARVGVEPAAGRRGKVLHIDTTGERMDNAIKHKVRGSKDMYSTSFHTWSSAFQTGDDQR